MSMHETKLRLRAPEPEDLDVMMELENGMELWEASTSTGPYSRYQLKRYLEDSQNDLYADHQLRLMLEHSEEGVVGMVDLCAFEPRHNRAEVGIIVSRQYRGQGFGRKGLELLEAHCFGVLGIRQLYAYVCEANAPSMRLFRSLDYACCGMLQEWVRIGNTYHTVCLFQKLNDRRTDR